MDKNTDEKYLKHVYFCYDFQNECPQKIRLLFDKEYPCIFSYHGYPYVGLIRNGKLSIKTEYNNDSLDRLILEEDIIILYKFNRINLSEFLWDIRKRKNALNEKGIARVKK